MLSEPHSAPELSEAQAEEITRKVMRRQLNLSLRVASIFVLLLFGLPLVNAGAPEIANQRVFGFTLTWLILGVLVYPITVLLAYFFVKNSDKIENDVHRDIVECTEDGAQYNNGGRP
jgi:uncharacterized membrane protein (DUF485 family)